MPRISVVLPIYRTAQYLRELHERLVKTLAPAGGDFELLMVDDGSPDGAWDILTELAERDGRVKALRLSRNFGQQAAVSAGFDHCRGDVIVLMDADLQDRPEDVPLLLRQLQGDVDVVYSIKEGVTEPPLTRWTSRLYHHLVGKFTGVPVPANIGVFRVFTRRFLDAILRYPEHNILFAPMMFYIGFRSAVVAVPHEPRRGSRSSYTFRKRLTLAVNSLVSHTDLPHRFLVWFGTSILLLAAVCSAVLAVRFLVSEDGIPSGLALLALLVAVAMGSTMVGLGILGIYLFRVFQEVLHRPRYLVARSINVVPAPGPSLLSAAALHTNHE